jgi:hypothetical protein
LEFDVVLVISEVLPLACASLDQSALYLTLEFFQLPDMSLHTLLAIGAVLYRQLQAQVSGQI